MSSPYAPPQDDPEQVPPNRAKPNKHAFVIWLVLIVLFVIAYRALAPPGSEQPPLSVVIDEKVNEAARPGLLIPLVAYLGVLVGLLALRRRLPAEYRTFELRTLAATKPEVVPVAEPRPIDLTLSGTDTKRPVTLRIDETGFLWRSEKRLLQSAEELEIRWSALESIGVSRSPSPLRVWAVVIGVLGLLQGRIDWRIAAGALVVAVVMFALGRNRARGQLTLVTETHALAFVSKELDVATQDRIIAAARERRPQAVPQAKQPGALRAMFVQPFENLPDVWRSDEALRAKALRKGTPFPEGKESAVGLQQQRLYALWDGGLRAIGPASFVLGGVLDGAPWFGLFAGAAWIAGFLLLVKTMPLFARFTGMSLVR